MTIALVRFAPCGVDSLLEIPAKSAGRATNAIAAASDRCAFHEIVRIVDHPATLRLCDIAGIPILLSQEPFDYSSNAPE